MHLSSRRICSNQLTVNRGSDCNLEKRELLTVEFATTHIGLDKRIGMYISDGPTNSNVSASVDRAGNYLHGLRIGGVQQYALLSDGSLSTSAKTELDKDIEALKKIPGNIGAILVADASDSKVHSSYRQRGNSKKISGQAWAAMFRAVVSYVQSQGISVIAIEPLNEPDAGGKLGSASDWKGVLSTLQADPFLTNYSFIGPSTVSLNNYKTWFDTIKDHIDWGASHWIGGGGAAAGGGGLQKWKDFIQDTQAAGKQVYASEVHHLIELITGAEYGIRGGTFWQTVSDQEAKFMQASTDGTRLGYEENFQKDSVAAAYKLNNENKVYLFAVSGPGDSATFNFRVTDRPVTVDGKFVRAGQVFKVNATSQHGTVAEVTW